MNDVIKELSTLRNEYEQILHENKALKDEVFIEFIRPSFIRLLSSQMKSKDDINRDLKLALTSSNNDAQTIYNQLRQLNTNLTDLQEKYDRDLADRDQRIDVLQNERNQLIVIENLSIGI